MVVTSRAWIGQGALSTFSSPLPLWHPGVVAVQSGTWRGSTPEARTAQRRERLLEATLAVWGEPGTTVTMTRVCAEAGLTERYFYESFSGLDQALAAVLDRVADEIETVTTRALETADPDPVAQVRASVLALVELLAADPRKGRVALVESQADPALRHRRRELLRRFARRSAQEARGHFGTAGWGPRDGEVAGLLFVGGLAELVTAWLDESLAATPAEIADAAVATYVGLRGPAGPL